MDGINSFPVLGSREDIVVVEVDKKPNLAQRVVNKFFETVNALKSNSEGVYKIAKVVLLLNLIRQCIKDTASKLNLFVQKLYFASGLANAVQFFATIPYWFTQQLKDDIKNGDGFNIAFMAGATVASFLDGIAWLKEIGLSALDKLSAQMNKVSFLRPIVKFGLGRVISGITGIAFLCKAGSCIKKLVEAHRLDDTDPVKKGRIRQAAIDLVWSLVEVGIAAVAITAFAVAAVATFWIGLPALAVGLVAAGLGIGSFISDYKRRANEKKYADAEKAFTTLDGIQKAKVRKRGQQIAVVDKDGNVQETITTRPAKPAEDVITRRKKSTSIASEGSVTSSSASSSVSSERSAKFVPYGEIGQPVLPPPPVAPVSTEPLVPPLSDEVTSEEEKSNASEERLDVNAVPKEIINVEEV